MEKRELLGNLNKIQYSPYISSCWLDIIKRYNSSFDNELSNKADLIIDILIAQNNNLYKEIDDLWIKILDN
ncbi:hypothetical protein J6I39_04045 [bacterium]|nr:hypothetical protein [bacterium]